MEFVCVRGRGRGSSTTTTGTTTGTVAGAATGAGCRCRTGYVVIVSIMLAVSFRHRVDGQMRILVEVLSVLPIRRNASYSFLSVARLTLVVLELRALPR